MWESGPEASVFERILRSLVAVISKEEALKMGTHMSRSLQSSPGPGAKGNSTWPARRRAAGPPAERARPQVLPAAGGALLAGDGQP